MAAGQEFLTSEPDMSQSAVFRSARNSSVWSRLPIIYKLWLALFWVPLLGLILPTLVFLPIVHQNLQADFSQKWIDTVQAICIDSQLPEHLENQDGLNRVWSGMKTDGAVGFHIGFASEGQSTAPPIDSAGPSSEVITVVETSSEDAIPDEKLPAADAKSPFELLVSEADSTAVFAETVVDSSNLLMAFEETASTSTQEVSIAVTDHWIASFDQGRPAEAPSHWEGSDETEELSRADWRLQVEAVDEQDRLVIRARSSRLPGGGTIRTSSGQNASVVLLFVVGRDELLSSMHRVNLLAWTLLTLGAAVLLPITHVFLKMLVVGPVQSLARTMRSSKPDTLGELHVPITRHDEIGELQLALNVLAAEISTKQQELSRYNDELEARVLTRTAELERTNKELDAFAYTVSHDLQAPLRNVSYIVGDELPDAIQKGELSRTEDLIGEVKRLCDFNIKMVRGLLDWARIGREVVKVETVSLNEVLQGVKSGLRTQLEEKSVELRATGSLPVVQGDLMQLHRVLTNLISNAIRYNDKAEKWIEVGWEKETPHGPAMYVRDNGIGVRPQHIERLFSLLVQLHDRKRFGEGVGMGLAIVKRIVDSYNGKIWPESVYGAGITFWFTLPPLVPSENLKP